VAQTSDAAERRPGRQRDPRCDKAIIEAVLDMIGTGATLSGLSLVTIAREAGVSRNSVYRRWKTKDDLYLNVLQSINRPLPALNGASAKDDVARLLGVVIERVLDKRASNMLRALNAEAQAFPTLHRRYFEEIVAPRRAAMNLALRRGIESGEVRADVDIDLVSDVLVSPVLARTASGLTSQLDPEQTGRRITELVFTGCANIGQRLDIVDEPTGREV
jgi:AcrR family transcriptional regulator